jgi:hypothetical protein
MTPLGNGLCAISLARSVVSRRLTLDRYRYTLFCGVRRPVICRRTVWHVKQGSIDVEV